MGMSSKSDRDNRSNQLNSNNDAYASSRSASTSDSDDCYPPLNSSLSNNSSYVSQRDDIKKKGQYGIGLVTSDGQARFFTFTLEATVDGFLGREANATAKLEIYFEFFAGCIRERFARYTKDFPLIFCMFDGTTSRLPWHGPLNLERPEEMRAFLVTCKNDVKHGEDPDTLIETLRAVLHPPFEDWGSFEAEGREASSFRFIYEERCKKAIMGEALKQSR